MTHNNADFFGDDIVDPAQPPEGLAERRRRIAAALDPQGPPIKFLKADRDIRMEELGIGSEDLVNDISIHDERQARRMAEKCMVHTVAEVAAKIGKSQDYIRRLMQSRAGKPAQWQGLRIGRVITFTDADLVANLGQEAFDSIFLQKQRNPAQSPDKAAADEVDPAQ